MSTNAYIGRPTANGGEGRYLHSDGYPSHVLKVLKELVGIHGAETVAAVIVDTGDWSTLEGTGYRVYPWHNDESNIIVDGYGVAYRKDENNEPMTGNMAEEYEWAYVIHPDKVFVFHNGSAFAVYRWDEITPVFLVRLQREGR